MVPSWSLYLAVGLLSGPWGPRILSALAPENEVPLRPTAWLPEDKVTSAHLPKGRGRRIYFTLKKRATAMSVTVSPCSVPIEWSLAVRTLKDKPPQTPRWSSKKSMPEVWWKGSGTEAKIYTFTGNTVDNYSGPTYAPSSIYILRMKSKEQDTRVSVYLHEGREPSGAFPELPPDPRVHTLGVGMTSITLSWAASPSVKSGPSHQNMPEYCVLVNRKHNYRSLCAAKEGMKTDRERDRTREKNEKRGKATLPILKDWWSHQRDAFLGHGSLPTGSGHDEDPNCVCEGAESVCTVSDLLPGTQYYFDVFVIDKRNGTSVAYTGTFGRTHEEAQPAVIALREGQIRWVTLKGAHSTGQKGGQVFSFQPRGWQQNGLLTLQTCNRTAKIKVSISSKGRTLVTQEVGEQLAQIWLQGGPTYQIQIQESERMSETKRDSSRRPTTLKMQASSAYHRRAAPVFPATLQMKSFNKLRSCQSVTLAWMGTEERSLYCVYQRRLSNDGLPGSLKSGTDQCLGPESRPDTERVLCKYFQELNPRRAVTTAAVGGLEPGTTYVFDVYLVRRWGLPVKYHSKTVRTRKEC